MNFTQRESASTPQAPCEDDQQQDTDWQSGQVSNTARQPVAALGKTAPFRLPIAQCKQYRQTRSGFPNRDEY